MTKRKIKQIHQSGQTLVTLLVFTVVAIAVTTTAVSVMINTMRSTSLTETRVLLTQAAESGVENAILRLLRDPDYAGEQLSVGETVVTITVTGTDTKLITATATFLDYIHTVSATLSYVNNSLEVSNWHQEY